MVDNNWYCQTEFEKVVTGVLKYDLTFGTSTWREKNRKYVTLKSGTKLKIFEGAEVKEGCSCGYDSSGVFYGSIPNYALEFSIKYNPINQNGQ